MALSGGASKKVKGQRGLSGRDVAGGQVRRGERSRTRPPHDFRMIREISLYCTGMGELGVGQSLHLAGLWIDDLIAAEGHS
jgi:hypothetical protein